MVPRAVGLVPVLAAGERAAVVERHGWVGLTVPEEPSTTLDAMAVASVFDQLELLLPRVSKPVQYVGGALNATVKDWDATAVRWALMYPDAYEVGVPNQGIMILYEVLNEQPDVLAERGPTRSGRIWKR